MQRSVAPDFVTNLAFSIQKKNRKLTEVQQLQDALVELADSKKWRELCFELTGDPALLKHVLLSAQAIKKSRYEDDLDFGEIFKYTRLLYEEPERLRALNQQRLANIGTGSYRGDSEHFYQLLDELHRLSTMGEYPEACFLRAMTGLLSFSPRIKFNELPVLFQADIQEWLQELDDQQFSRLAKVYFGEELVVSRLTL